MVVVDDVRLGFDDLAANGVQRLTALPVVAYEDPAPAGTEARRLIERTRTLFRRDDLAGLLPLGRHPARGLPGESYRLAFTSTLLDRGFRRAGTSLLPDPASVLAGQGADRGGYVDLDGDGHWWIPSGRQAYSPGPGDGAAAELAFATSHFFLAHRHVDPFGGTVVVGYDTDDLLLVSTEDALGNAVSVENDYRVLQPRLRTDPNGNRSMVAFDALGMVVGTAVQGKAAPAVPEGDSFDAFAVDLSPAQIAAYVAAADPRSAACGLLGSATTRIK